MIEKAQLCDNRKQKHVELYDAIKRIGTISNQLDMLIDLIQGPRPRESEKQRAQKDMPPTLIDVLNIGANEIIEYTESANKRIEQIKEMLF